MKRLVVVAIVLLMTVGLSRASLAQSINGEDWATLGRCGKVGHNIKIWIVNAYVIGFAKASSLGAGLISFDRVLKSISFDAKVPTPHTTPIFKVETLYKGIMDIWLPPFNTADEYVKALDQFYSDYKNSKIQFEDALRIISAQVRGRDKDEIDKLLQSARKQGTADGISSK